MVEKKGIDVAVGLVRTMIEDINPITKKLMLKNTDINRKYESQ